MGRTEASNALAKTATAAAIITRAGMFAFIWWILANGEPSSWWIGLPAVLAATAVSMALMPPIRVVWRAWISFIPFFALHSLKGAVDVAWRVFHPRMPIAPDVVRYPSILPSGLPRMMMVSIVNLLPGTLCVEMEHNTLKIHVLDTKNDFPAELAAVEYHVARIFNVPHHNEKERQLR